MNLILARHGETKEHKEGRTQGQLPGQLTELGIQQSEAVAVHLSKIKLDAIYSSDLDRAWYLAGRVAH